MFFIHSLKKKLDWKLLVIFCTISPIPTRALKIWSKTINESNIQLFHSYYIQIYFLLNIILLSKH